MMVRKPERNLLWLQEKNKNKTKQINKKKQTVFPRAKSTDLKNATHLASSWWFRSTLYFDTSM